MSQHDREKARYQQGYIEGSRTNRSNSAAGVIVVVGIFSAAILCVGIWFAITQTNQQSGGDTDVINVPAPEAPSTPPDINITLPAPPEATESTTETVPTQPTVITQPAPPATEQADPAPSIPSASNEEKEEPATP